MDKSNTVKKDGEKKKQKGLTTWPEKFTNADRLLGRIPPPPTGNFQKSKTKPSKSEDYCALILKIPEPYVPSLDQLEISQDDDFRKILEKVLKGYFILPITDINPPLEISSLIKIINQCALKAEVSIPPTLKEESFSEEKNLSAKEFLAQLKIDIKSFVYNHKFRELLRESLTPSPTKEETNKSTRQRLMESGLT